MSLIKRRPIANEVASLLAEVSRDSNCEGCDVLRGANILAKKHFKSKYGPLFEKNLSAIVTTHVNLNCDICPVDDIMKMLSRDRLAAVAAVL